MSYARVTFTEDELRVLITATEVARERTFDNKALQQDFARLLKHLCAKLARAGKKMGIESCP